MPSAKTIFFTADDDAALEDVLRQKFPNITFGDYGIDGPDTWQEFDSLAEATSTVDWPLIMVRPPNWRFKASYRRQFPSIEDTEAYLPDNLPDEIMMYRPSEFFDRFTDESGKPILLGDGSLQVGVSLRMSENQKKFRGKIWRLLNKVGTNRLLSWHGPAGKEAWHPYPGRDTVAGFDAVRWAEEDERRYFYSSSFHRPISDPVPGVRPIPPGWSKPYTRKPG